MKNIFKTSLLLLLAASFSACDGFLPALEPQDEIETTTEDIEAVDAYIKLSKTIVQNMKSIDGRIKENINIMDATLAEEPTFRPLVETAKTISEKVENLALWMDQLCERIQYETNNFSRNVHQKSIVEDFLITGGAATELKELLLKQKNDLIESLDDLLQRHETEPIAGLSLSRKSIDKLKTNLGLSPIYVDDWEADNFGGLTPTAAYAQLRKIQSDCKNASLQIINFLSDEMGNKVMPDTRFEIFANAAKPFVFLGETYEAEIALGETITQAEFTVSVNGSPLRIEDGKSKYAARPGSVGAQSYTANITVVNPLTGERERFRKEFKYEVGVPSVSVSPDQMNVLYIGVDNPMSIMAAGVSSNDLQVSVSGGGGAFIEHLSGHQYNIKASKAHPKGQYCYVDISNKRTGKKITSIPFRINSCPDPTIQLANGSSVGVVKSAEMQEQEGLIATLDNFDFDVKCQVQSFKLYYIAPRQDAVALSSIGGRFTGQTLAAIKAAKPGTAYLFTDVKGRCPGDSAARELNGLAFQVR